MTHKIKGPFHEYEGFGLRIEIGQQIFFVDNINRNDEVYSLSNFIYEQEALPPRYYDLCFYRKDKHIVIDKHKSFNTYGLTKNEKLLIKLKYPRSS